MKKMTLLAFSLFALIVLAACQNQGDGDDAITEDENATAEESNNQSDTEAEGDAGELVVYSAGPGGMVEELAEAFENETNITVELYQSTTGDVLGRLEAEADNPIADVVQLASLPAAIDYKNDDLIMPYITENHDELYEDWVDEEGYYYGFSGSALAIVYNTENVTNPPTDLSDLQDEQYQDKIAIPDPSQSGTALDLLSIKINNEGDAAWDEYESLKENGMSLAGANNPALESVITGQNDIIYGGVDYMAYNAIENGEPVDLVFPASGTAISPRPAFILESTQNEDNAKLYMDFITSETGQKIVDDHNLMPANSNMAQKENKVVRDDIEEYEYDWEALPSQTEDVLSQFMELMR